MTKEQDAIEGRLGNTYVGNKTPVRALSRLVRRRAGKKPDWAVVNEGRKTDTLAARLKGYRVHRATHGPMKGRTDVLVLVRRKHRYLGSIAIEVDPGIPGIQNAHNRNVIAALFSVNGFGKCAVIGAHPTPAPKILNRADSKHTIARRYMDHAEVTHKLVDFLQYEGYYVFFGSDTQLTKHADVPWSFGHVFKKTPLEPVVWEHIDVLAGDDRLEGTGGILEPKGSSTGSDHPFLWGSWRKKKK